MADLGKRTPQGVQPGHGEEGCSVTWDGGLVVGGRLDPCVTCAVRFDHHHIGQPGQLRDPLEVQALDLVHTASAARDRDVAVTLQRGADGRDKVADLVEQQQLPRLSHGWALYRGGGGADDPQSAGYELVAEPVHRGGLAPGSDEAYNIP